MREAAEFSPSTREAALLEWIQQLAPYGVITLDESFRVQGWNRWMETHGAAPARDVLGKSFFDVVPDLEQRRLASAFKRALLGESCVLSTTLHRYVVPMPSPTGLTPGGFMLQTARISPLHSGGAICGIVIVIEDVTQREEQSAAILEQHRREEILSWISAHLLKADKPGKAIRQLFFKIAEHLDFDTFFLYLRDPETDVIQLADAGGVSPETQAAAAHCNLFLEQAQISSVASFKSIQSNENPGFEMLRKAGISAAVALPLLADNRPLGLLCFGTCSRSEITSSEIDLLSTVAQYLAISVERERINFLLQKAKQQISDHALLLEKKVEERTANLREIISELEIFSYTMAHDLKAPVRAMLAYCQILTDEFAEALPPDATAIIHRLESPARRMETLIADLLKFSKVSRQEMVLSRVELEPVLADILALRDLDTRQAVTVVHPLHAVLGQRDLLHQALVNLIDNAVKFVAPGTQARVTVRSERTSGLSPSTRETTLLFSSREPAAHQASRSGEFVRIWVSDEGIGVPPELHQKIFGIFERGVGNNAYEGTGMGLAIVARAIQRMGGTCGLESAPGKGSRFWVDLPAA
jgi:signal transduction histidine kinase